jgi:hypothetical protein
MKRSVNKFVGMLALDLLASYAPGILWVPSVVGVGGSLGLIFLISPVALLILIVSPTDAGPLGLGILSAYWLLMSGLAWCFNWSRYAFFIIPGLLLICSLAQGLLFAEIIHGIDAIGHS